MDIDKIAVFRRDIKCGVNSENITLTKSPGILIKCHFSTFSWSMSLSGILILYV
jgi:hypothetical protein